MTLDKKIKTTLVIFGITALLLIVSLIFSPIGSIKKESENFLFQKRRLLELETKSQNLQKFQTNSKAYQNYLDKAGELLINPAEPIDFIKFLEKAATGHQLKIEISSLPASPKEGEAGPALNFKLTLAGSFPNFMKFFGKLEFGPYLTETLNLKISRLAEQELKTEELRNFSLGDIKADLLIKVYAQ